MKFSISILVCLLLSTAFQLSGQSFTYNSPVCKNGANPAPIPSSGFPAGGSYSGTGLSVNATNGVVNLALTSPGIYTVVYTSTAAPISATIEVLPLPPVISITGNTACATTPPSQFTLVATSADPFMSYTWFPGVTPGNTYNTLTVGNVTVIGMGVNGCTTQAFMTTSTVAPIVPSVAGPTIICEGASFTLTASGSMSYTWSTGALTATMTDTPPSVSIYQYTVTGTDQLGCEGKKTHSVAVFPNPTVSISGQPTLCAGYSLALSASGASTYVWSTGHSTKNVTVVPTSSITTYTVVGTSNSCTNSAIHSVTWIELPKVTVVGSSSVCARTSLTLVATSSNGIYTYTWGPSGHIGDTLVVTPVTPGTFTYTAWAMENGCPGADVHQVLVAPIPNVLVLPATSTVCSGKGVIKTAINAQTYTWSTGVVSNTVLLTPNDDSTYYVVGINANGCRDTTYFVINVFQTPTITVNSMSICSGETATLEAFVEPSEGVNITWKPVSWTGGTFTPAPLITTNYTVTATAPGPCIHTAVATVTVVKTVMANVSFKYDGPYCNGNYSAIPIPSASMATGGSYFSVSNDLMVNEATGIIPLSGVAEGFYQISYSVATKGCTLTNTGSSGFLVDKSIYLEATPPYIEIYPGNEVTLKHTGGATKYQWYPPVDLDCVNCEYPVAMPLQSTNYCVKSGQPCVFGTCIMVEVLCMNYGDLSVPNAFSPNNDGRNDKFCLQGWEECNIDFYIAIFDRWGTKVYESTDPSFCWDGNFNGSPLPSAVYMYQINAQFKKDRAFKKSGNISLIK